MTNVDISYVASLEKILKKRSNSEYPTRINCQIKNTLSHPAQGNISVPVNVPIDDSLIWRSDIGQWNWVFAHSYSDCSHYAPLYPPAYYTSSVWRKPVAALLSDTESGASASNTAGTSPRHQSLLFHSTVRYGGTFLYHTVSVAW